MNNLLIHIGYHKTGTTWMQEELFITSNNVFEPIKVEKKGNINLSSLFIKGQDGYLLPEFSMNKEQIQEKLSEIIQNKRKTNKTFVISNERLSGNPHSSGFDSKIIAHRIKYNFPSAKILIVIREQKSFLLSSYSQYLKVGGTHNISKYLNTQYDKKRPYFSPHHINYILLIKEYIELFGKENILVLPYELFKTKPNQFIFKLGKFVGQQINIDNKRFKIYKNKEQYYFIRYYFRNLNYFLKRSSLNNYSTASNRITKKIASYFYKLLVKVIPKIWHNKTKNKIKKYIDEWVQDRYSKSNKELSELINIDLSKYGYH